MEMTTTIPAGQGPRSNDGRFVDQNQFRDEPEQLEEQLELDFWEDDGTFDFPPAPRDVKQIVDFWMKVKVPDDVLANLERGYDYEYKRDCQKFEDDFVTQVPPPDPKRVRKLPGLQMDWEERKAAYVQQQKDEWGTIPDRSQLRSLVRIGKMGMDIKKLNDPVQHEQLVTTNMKVPGNPTSTMRVIWRKYRLGIQTKYMVRSANMGDELRKMNENLTRVAEGTDRAAEATELTSRLIDADIESKIEMMKETGRYG